MRKHTRQFAGRSVLLAGNPATGRSTSSRRNARPRKPVPADSWPSWTDQIVALGPLKPRPADARYWTTESLPAC